MKTNYQLKEVQLHKEGKIASLKRRLNAVLTVLFSEGFIVLTSKETDVDNLEIDISNHKIDNKTTVYILENYRNFLIESARNNAKMDKNIEKWLHTES